MKNYFWNIILSLVISFILLVKAHHGKCLGNYVNVNEKKKNKVNIEIVNFLKWFLFQSLSLSLLKPKIIFNCKCYLTMSLPVINFVSYEKRIHFPAYWYLLAYLVVFMHRIINDGCKRGWRYGKSGCEHT